jgi:hypothetical protein
MDLMEYLVRLIPPEASGFPLAPEVWQRADVGKIDQFPWTHHDVRPETSFRLLYSPGFLFLRFDCREMEIAASRMEHQTEVWKDNCVEMFVSPSPDLSLGYFNFEFNCLGAMLLAFGEGRSGRRSIPLEDLGAIQISTALKHPVHHLGEEPQEWFLEALIPLELISRYSGAVPPVPGARWRANFNKCAESVRDPHWAVWSHIETGQPDFHQPQFFGTLLFE